MTSPWSGRPSCSRCTFQKCPPVAKRVEGVEAGEDPVERGPLIGRAAKEQAVGVSARHGDAGGIEKLLGNAECKATRCGDRGRDGRERPLRRCLCDDPTPAFLPVTEVETNGVPVEERVDDDAELGSEPDVASVLCLVP